MASIYRYDILNTLQEHNIMLSSPMFLASLAVK